LTFAYLGNAFAVDSATFDKLGQYFNCTKDKVQVFVFLGFNHSLQTNYALSCFPSIKDDNDNDSANTLYSVRVPVIIENLLACAVNTKVYDKGQHEKQQAAINRLYFHFQMRRAAKMRSEVNF